VTARITPSGLETLAALDAPVAELHRRQFGKLSGTDLTQLTAVLEKLHDSLHELALEGVRAESLLSPGFGQLQPK
jgi:hypothetical protein